jgi:L-asparaginase
VLPVYGFQGGGKTLKDAGAIFADDLPPQKARLLLMLLIQAGVRDPQAIQKFFDL